MSKKKENVGASAKKPSRSTLQSSPKKAKDLRSDRSREEAKRSERHLLYKQMLRKAPKHDIDYYSSPYGFCEMLSQMQTSRRDPNKLPELRAQKPINARAYWWNAGEWRPRRRALRAAIKASAPATGMRKAATKERVPASRRTAAKRSGAKHGPKASPKPSKR